MKPFAVVVRVVCGAAVVLSAAAAQACFMYATQPVQVWMDHIDVVIKDQVAVKKYLCVFRNPNPVVVTGATCYMELEPGAHVDNMRVLVDGKEMQAEILEASKAKEVFNDIVKRGGSPALLEYFGNQLIQTQVPRIAANGTVTVELTYTMVLDNRGGVVRLQMLNTNPKALMQELKSASVSVKISSQQPIKNIYSPTHPIQIGEAEDADVLVSWSQENYLPKHPFVLYYQIAEDEFGATLLTHRELGEQGYFMLMLSPTIGQGVGRVTDARILPKDIVFCVDTSGSMLEGNKMEQARAALKYCIENLRPIDRFNIVDFSTGVRTFRENELVPVNDETRQAALKYVERLTARGGTAIQDALTQSLDLLRGSDRLKMVLFATDGFPTIGERQPDAILRNVAKANTHDVRMFVFGEGFDVNTKLLDFLALNHRGEADYVLPEEDIAQKISRFYDRVGSPVLTDLRISFDRGLGAVDVYPQQVADVYRGEQVVIYGRYSGSGKHTIRVQAQAAGETKTLAYELEFPEYSDDDKHAFVPRLWAGKKVDHLLAEIRKSQQEDKELVDEITRLAKRYGIVTPYTSFLMAEDIVSGDMAQGPQLLLGRLRAGKAAESAAAPMAQKAAAVQDARQLANQRRELDRGGFAGLDEQADAVLKASGRDGSVLQAMRYIGTKTFYHAENAWFESDYDPQKVKDVKTVSIGSEEYFRLLNDNPRYAKYLALGEVTVKLGDTWYRFVSQKK
jgi:Ca-activated chloride channel family protein